MYTKSQKEWRSISYEGHQTLCILLLLNFSLQEGFYIVVGSANGAQVKPIIVLADQKSATTPSEQLFGLEGNTCPGSHWSGAELAPDWVQRHQEC